jgi:hypothetical protein
MHDMPTHDSGMDQMTHATDSMDDMGSDMGDMHMEVRVCRDGDLSTFKIESPLEGLSFSIKTEQAYFFACSFWLSVTHGRASSCHRMCMVFAAA